MNADFEISSGRVIIVGDTRPKHPLELIMENTGDIPSRVFKAIAQEKPAALFHLGDMVTIGALRSSWKKTFEKDAKPLFEADVPIFPVLGNHEYKLGR